MIELYTPALGDLWFRQGFMSDEETMSYNHAWGGTIPFPEREWGDWYDHWVAHPEGKRFYRYLLDRDTNAFVGEVAFRFDPERTLWLADVIVAAEYRGRGYGRQGLELLCRAAAARGIETLYDDIAADNPGIAMFLKAGFTEEYRTSGIIMLKKELTRGSKISDSEGMQMEKYASILKPLRIGNTVFRNRFFSAPTGLYDLTPQRAPTDDYIAYFERKAKGGCASVNIGECNIDDEGIGSPNSYEVPNLSDHKWNKEALGKLADAITRNGAVATIELQKTGRIKSDEPGRRMVLSPCDGPHPYDSRVKCRAMTEEEILHVIDTYASAAEYAKGRGFGMVTVHAGHGWLLHQFHCPNTNRRTDKWGGNPENRCRFTVAVIDEIHKRCGRDFPVEVRISGSEAFEGGYGIEEGVEIAKQLDGHADIIHVSCGNLFAPGTDFHTHPGIFQEEGMNVKYAAEIKKHVKKSYVATIGALTSLDVLEEIVASGKADIVEMARGLICDPDLPIKAKSGREKEARKCLRCFKCVGQDYQDGRLFCAINPASGKEREAARVPQPLSLRRVLIAGGGVAGMQAAITARGVGHEVILCEKGPELGGVLLCEKDVPFKQRIGDYIERQKYMLEKLGVEVRLNTPVTPELCAEIKPDAIVAALGAVTATPPIPGLEGENVKTAVEVFADASLAKGKSVILGAGTTGLELAIYLASLGKEVRILELRSAEEAASGAATYAAQLAKYDLKVEYGVRADAILPDAVKAKAGEDERLIPCDTVINALGLRPRWEEADALRSCAGEFYQIGDCLRARNLMATTSEAWTAARNIGC